MGVPGFHEDSCPTCLTLPALPFQMPRRLVRTAGVKLLKTASAGCQQCQMLLSGGNKFVDSGKISAETQVNILYRRGESLDVSYYPPNSDSFDLEYFFTPDIYQSPEVQWTGIGEASDVNLQSPEVCAAWARSWLQDCDREHYRCKYRVSEKTLLPKRVIKVNRSGDPCLYISQGVCAKYIALSHVWGSVKPLQCTLGNVDELVEKIPFGSLPQTFKDAVVMARLLEIDYLWIDSICIIQDSVEDWEVEAAKMGSIYSNAYLTIAANASLNCTGGLFRGNDTLPRTETFTMKLNGGKTETVKARRAGNLKGQWSCAHEFETASPSLLDTRAWTYQERFLSPRILHFSFSELAWECYTHEACQCTVGVRADHLSGFKLSTLQGSYKTRDEVDATLKRFDIDWDMLVQQYAKRAMTYETDKLPALSGIVETLSRYRDDQYVCGHWRKELPVSLMWRVTKPGLGERLTAYHAPSWSWACMKGRVAGLSADNPNDNAATPIDIIEVVCIPAGLNPFGAVKSGHITLRGHLLKVTVRAEPRTPKPKSHDLSVAGEQHIAGTLAHTDGRLVTGALYPDTVWADIAQEVSTGNQIVSLIGHSYGGSVRAIALMQVEAASTYRRVGAILWDELEWKGNARRGVDTEKDLLPLCTHETITII